MNASNLDIATVVREALLAAFADISTKSGLAPTHLDMKLRLDDGTGLRAEYKPVKEGGLGLKVEVKSSAI